MKKTALFLFCFGLSAVSLFAQEEVIESIYFIVNDDIITKSDFDEAKFYYKQAQNMGQVTNAGSDEGMVSNMIIQLLVKQEAVRRGSFITAEDISNDILRIAEANGISDLSTFAQVLASQGIDFRFFFKMRESLRYTEELLRGSTTFVEPTAQEIRDYYENNKKEFKISDKLYKLARIQLIPEGDQAFIEYRKKRKEAGEIRQKLLDGADFAKTAEEVSDDYSTKSVGGELGWLLAEELNMNPDLKQAAAELKKGEITEVITEKNGLSIYKLLDVKTKGYIPFEKAVGFIKNFIMQNQRQEGFANQLKGIIRSAYIEKKTDKFKGLKFN